MVTLEAILVWMFFGLIIGLLARAVVPGRQAMGWFGTIGLGIVGSFLGGFLTSLFNGGDPVQPAGLLMSIVGAVIVLMLAAQVPLRRI